MSKKPTVLMILDGYGLRDDKHGNAVAEAATPVMDKLMAECPFVRGNASGMAVGLPEGQMGNSEVGHLNMGAGRIVYQDLTKITKAIQDGDFFENKALVAACANSSAAFPAFTEPPYWMRIASAVASSYTSAIHSRMPLHTSSACSVVAVFPVPIAQIGS